MIRINLLPTRQAAKRESGRQYLVAALGTLLVAIGVNYLVYNSLAGELKSKQMQLADKERRIAELNKVIGEVDKLRDRKKEVTAKLEKLEELKRRKAGPIRLMDALQTVIPKKVWLTEFTEDKGGLKVLGGADTIEDVSDFLKSLSAVVWSPKGMARIVERKRDAPIARIELISAEGSIDEFPVTQLGNFFTNVELKQTERAAEKSGTDREEKRYVKFEILAVANYAN